MYNTCPDSKGGQIKGLDITFQMHSIAKIFDNVKYLKNEKNQKLKKKKRENRENGPKRTKMAKWPKFFFHATNPRNKTKKTSVAKLNSVQWLERYSLSHTR